MLLNDVIKCAMITFVRVLRTGQVVGQVEAGRGPLGIVGLGVRPFALEKFT